MTPPRRLAAALCVALACATGDAAAQPTPPPASWVGVWLLHEPWHGSYAGAVYRFEASGALTLTAMLDTTARGGRPRQVGSVFRGRVGCRFGARWRPGASPERVVIAGDCNDGRARDIELTVGPSWPMPLTSGYVPRVLRVGGQRGWERGSSWAWELYRCDADPAGRCADFEDRRGVFFPTAPR